MRSCTEAVWKRGVAPSAAYACTYLCVCVRACVCLCVYVSLSVCMCVSVSLSVCVCVRAFCPICHCFAGGSGTWSNTPCRIDIAPGNGTEARRLRGRTYCTGDRPLVLGRTDPPNAWLVEPHNLKTSMSSTPSSCESLFIFVRRILAPGAITQR